MPEESANQSVVRAVTLAAGSLAVSCLAFGSVGEAVVWAGSLAFDIAEEPGYLTRQATKAVLLGAVAVVVLAGLVVLARRVPVAPAPPEATRPRPRWWLAVVPAMAISALIVFPNRTLTPRPEPDELHHLVVARNIAEHGAYASGHPAEGLLYFDPYDSVGPAVLLPLGGAMRAFGPTFSVARAFMGAVWLLLTAAAFALLLREFGPLAAAMGGVLMLGAWGSVYLARTLYGETAALLFVLLALGWWRRALRSPGWSAAGFVAGACFGLALLSKLLLGVLAWPLLGAALYDRLTARRIQWPHLLAPGIASAAVVLGWMAAQSLAAPATDAPGAGGNGAALFAVYRHNLMFGFAGTPTALAWLVSAWPQALAGLAGVLWCARRLLVTRYDPPLVALVFGAFFLAFWWVFFTPGTIYRYMWYTAAVTGLFAGVAAWESVALAAARGVSVRVRAVGVVAAVLLIAPYGASLKGEAVRVGHGDETVAVRALTEAVATLPPDARVASTAWPANRILNFFANRYVARMRADDALEEFDAVVHAPDAPPGPPFGPPVFAEGPYAMSLNEREAPDD